MLLFKPEHVAPIQEDRKTQTRRTWKKARCLVGAEHQCRTQMLKRESTFAVVEILEVRRERLQDVSEADARAEGYPSRLAFIHKFTEIYGAAAARGMVWVVSFRRVL